MSHCSRLASRWVFLLPLLAILLLPQPGCASRGGPADSNRKAVAALAEVNQELEDLDAAVLASDEAMRGLSAESADLTGAFKAFGLSVAGVESAYDNAVKDWRDMRQRSDAYITAWQEQVAAVQNESLRAAALERRETVRSRFEGIRDAARTAEAEFKPFLQQLQDLEQVLGLDPTPAAVSAVGPTVEETLVQAGEVRTSIDALRTELRSISVGITAPPAKK